MTSTFGVNGGSIFMWYGFSEKRRRDSISTPTAPFINVAMPRSM